MSNQPKGEFSDYTPKKVFIKRAENSKSNRDEYYIKVVDTLDSKGMPTMPVFRENFNVFADEIAYGLRRKIVYRTDNGHFARGLVRANGHLKIVHELYKKHDWKDGTPIDLTILIVRRKDKQPPFRWAMDILYKVNDFVDGDGFEIKADEGRVQNMKCGTLDRILSVIEAQANNLSGPSKKQIHNIIDIAENVGCPNHINLWYFNRLVMKDFVSWRTDDKTRREMIKHKTKFPFDGHTWPHGNWRIYPFQNILRLYAHSDIEAKAKSIMNVMEYHRSQMEEGLKDLNRELNLTGPARSNLKIPFVGGGGADIYGLAKTFFGDMNKLRENKNHLYYAFR